MPHESIRLSIDSSVLYNMFTYFYYIYIYICVSYAVFLVSLSVNVLKLSERTECVEF